jgi:hypothetical protein
VQRSCGLAHGFGTFAANVGDIDATPSAAARMIFVIDFASMEIPV